MSTETLDVLVALDAAGEPPSEFRIFGKGEVKTRKGQFLFDDVASASVMQHAVDFGADYPMDYGHAMLGSAAVDPAESHKAAGWFRPAIRNGELWATSVTWTPAAAKRLRDREYRYVSPAFNCTAVALDEKTTARRITELINCALTNVPATKGLTPLVLATETAGASPEGENDMSTTLLATLAATAGCGASENEIIGRFTEQRDALSELGKATGKDKPKEAVGVALAWGAELQSTRTALEKLSLDAKKADVARKVEEKIDALLLAPAQREFAVSLGMKDEEMLGAFLSTLNTPIVNGGPVPKGAPPKALPKGVVLPPPEELKLLGISAEDFAKTQSKMIEEGMLE